MEAQNDILDVIIDLTKQGYQVKFKPGWDGQNTVQIELYKDGLHVAELIDISEFFQRFMKKDEMVLHALKKLLCKYDYHVGKRKKEHADI